MQTRRSTVILVAVFATGVLLAGLAGIKTAPSDELLDPRRSTYLVGPEGAKGLVQALSALGMTVEQRTTSLFDLRDVTADGDRLLVLLGVSAPPNHVERAELARYVMDGGSLFLAGWNGVESCFGIELDYRSDSVALDVDSSLSAPRTDVVIDEPEDRPMEPQAEEQEGRILCTVPSPVKVDSLLLTVDGAVAATKREYQGGGSVLALADSRLLSNRVLKETDIGVVILPWFLDRAGRSVVFDEYHHGFGEGGSIFVAAWSWMRQDPGGWMMLQLAFAGLVALFATAIRFGPTMSLVERRRRSALEHLDALAVGLERARSYDVAARLITGGLRRRLTAGGAVLQKPTAECQGWLESLARAAPTAEARASVERLGRLLQHRNGNEHVLAIAATVEDVWEALRPTEKLARS